MAMAVVRSTTSELVMARNGPRLLMLAGLLVDSAGLFSLSVPTPTSLCVLRTPSAQLRRPSGIRG